MSTPQAESERALFKLFAETVELSIASDSIESRNPPEPDIRCTLAEAGPQCFELVEIIDSDLAKAVGILLKFQNRLVGMHWRVRSRAFRTRWCLSASPDPVRMPRSNTPVTYC